MLIASLSWKPSSQDDTMRVSSAIKLRGPRIIAVAGNRGHLWGEQHRIETRTKPNHSRVNSGRLTISGNYSRSPIINRAIRALHRRFRRFIQVEGGIHQRDMR
jgi:hypothetical protein